MTPALQTELVDAVENDPDDLAKRYALAHAYLLAADAQAGETGMLLPVAAIGVVSVTAGAQPAMTTEQAIAEADRTLACVREPHADITQSTGHGSVPQTVVREVSPHTRSVSAASRQPVHLVVRVSVRVPPPQVLVQSPSANHGPNWQSAGQGAPVQARAW